MSSYCYYLTTISSMILRIMIAIYCNDHSHQKNVLGVVAVEEEGFGYSPALLTLASLYESGYEPAIQQDAGQAARQSKRIISGGCRWYQHVSISFPSLIWSNIL